MTDQPLKLPVFILVVVLAQAAFGMWTVTLKLWPQVVTGHLLDGFATLSLLFLLTLRLSGVLPALAVPRRLQRWATAGLVLAIVQIALGGWVSSITRRWPASTCRPATVSGGQTPTLQTVFILRNTLVPITWAASWTAMHVPRFISPIA